MNKQVKLVAQQPSAAATALPKELIVLDAEGQSHTYRLVEAASVPDVAPPGEEYVDPFLFESGYFKSRAEYDELSRTAQVVPRAEQQLSKE